jgi:DNA-binding beta-propeller fold protein YncE
MAGHRPDGDLAAVGAGGRHSGRRWGGWVTELDAATGTLVQNIKGSGYGFNHPAAISSDGTHVWVANEHGSSVTELDAATGALVQVITSDGFHYPRAIFSDGSHVWVTNEDESVTELNAATGALAKVINGSRYIFNGPDAISSDGTDVWVANISGESVTAFPA